ncbi:MAG: MATE family efflux transporter [Solirubrobacteraceae bacterium]
MLSRRGLAAHGTVFLATRGTNAVLALAQIALVSHFYSTSASATFFVFWTVVWAASVLLRFGTDQIIPKHVALASRDEDLSYLGGFRAVLRWTGPVAVLASIPVLLVTLPSTTFARALEVAPALLIAALAWAAAYVAMGVAKGYGQVSLAGIVQGTLVPGGFTLAAPVAAIIDRSWVTLAYVSALGVVVATAVSLALVARAVGHKPVEAAFRVTERPISEPDRIPTGVLGAIIEIVLWLPLWLASAVGLSGSEVAGLYAALRVSGTFSWAFTAVVSVSVPMMARALAEADYHALSRLLWRTAVAGLLITAPIAVLGIAFAPEILRLLDPTYAAYASTLVILIVARLFDAATGPLSECLVLGGRARWEMANQLLGLVVIGAVGLALEPSVGIEAFAWGTAVALTVENLVRVEQLRRLFRTHWRPSAETIELASAREPQAL